MYLYGTDNVGPGRVPALAVQGFVVGVVEEGGATHPLTAQLTLPGSP